MLRKLLIFLVLFECCCILAQCLSRNTTQAFWPSAVPLAVRSPYFSCWQSMAGSAHTLEYGPMFWSGSVSPYYHALGWTGYIRVDNFTYQWLGDNATVHSASLDSFHITPTRTIFNLKAGPMNLNITFLTPIEVGTRNRSQVVTWSTDVNILDGVIYHEAKVESPSGISDKMEVNGQVDDGTAPYVTYQTGQDVDLHDTFKTTGSLMNERDVSYRAIDNNLPAFAIAADLGNITMTQNPFVWSVGYARPFAIYANWTGIMQTRSPYYMHEYVDNEDMVCSLVSCPQMSLIHC
ncbi:hypothetical protein IEO21_09159 [Rhodonia placenta]|uniref:Glutaminase A N-terminal domain-containing protein n=1 Tax=Rhodonia placenta TaxID=104341 RepID=A0A8H7NUW9_9APHY|nr:hypothetical protein IEO21_09159 [Postia placenta]